MRKLSANSATGAIASRSSFRSRVPTDDWSGGSGVNSAVSASQNLYSTAPTSGGTSTAPENTPSPATSSPCVPSSASDWAKVKSVRK